MGVKYQAVMPYDMYDYVIWYNTIRMHVCFPSSSANIHYSIFYLTSFHVEI